MPNYRRAYIPGGIVFLTVVTYRRTPILDAPGQRGEAVAGAQLRQVMREAPFRITAAVVLPDHAHFLWSLPRGDADDPRHVGRMKVLFTRSLPRRGVASPELSRSRHRHRESDVWHRRFWEHTVESEEGFEALTDDIHHHPVRHGLTSCPHLWPYSSFGRWVRAGRYPERWGCGCDGRTPVLSSGIGADEMAGESSRWAVPTLRDSFRQVLVEGRSVGIPGGVLNEPASACGPSLAAPIMAVEREPDCLS